METKKNESENQFEIANELLSQYNDLKKIEIFKMKTEIKQRQFKEVCWLLIIEKWNRESASIRNKQFQYRHGQKTLRIREKMGRNEGKNYERP